MALGEATVNWSGHPIGWSGINKKPHHGGQNPDMKGKGTENKVALGEATVN